MDIVFLPTLHGEDQHQTNNHPLYDMVLFSHHAHLPLFILISPFYLFNGAFISNLPNPHLRYMVT